MDFEKNNYVGTSNQNLKKFKNIDKAICTFFNLILVIIIIL
jgi:hypothetical protein